MRAMARWWKGVGLRLASFGWFKRFVGSTALTRLDRFLIARTGRSVTTPDVTDGGLPMMNLTATGAKTGEPRTVPLAYLNDDGAIYVIGTNWGSPGHPSWTTNLLPHPIAPIRSHEWTGPVTAQHIQDGASSDVWPRLIEHLPNWKRYREEVRDRQIRVFRLDPATP